MMFFVVFIDRMRIFLGNTVRVFAVLANRTFGCVGSMGNKTEQLAPIIGSMILGVFAIVGYCYFVELQIYV